MYHSVYFGSKNTYDDWHLISAERPYIAPPSVKTKYVDIPGGNGSIDYTESLTGYPVYNNREGSIEFTILNDLDDVEYIGWQEIYSDILNYLHGKSMQMILEDSEDYYFDGRYKVSSYTPGSSGDDPRSKITIDYNVYPYMIGRYPIEEQWANISGSAVTAWTTVDLGEEQYGNMIVIPTFAVSKQTTVRIINPNTNSQFTQVIEPGTSILGKYIIFGNGVKLQYKLTNPSSSSDSGTVYIQFRKARL